MTYAHLLVVLGVVLAVGIVGSTLVEVEKVLGTACETEPVYHCCFRICHQASEETFAPFSSLEQPLVIW